jgi:hypothetical protein
MRELGLANAPGISQNCSKNRGQLAGRAGNDAQHFCCGFLSLQRLVALTGELSEAGLRFVVGSR